MKKTKTQDSLPIVRRQVKTLLTSSQAFQSLRADERRQIGDDTAKIGNYLSSVLAMREARLAGADEALILDGKGRLLEGASSNVFAITRGRLVTPAEEHGILAGITRAHVLAAAGELGVPVELRPLELQAAYGADELFISSSIRELLPVVALDGRTIGTGTPGPFFRRLLDAFRVRAHGRQPSA